MGMREITMYTLDCDWQWPEQCPSNAQKNSDFAAWADPGSARDDAMYADWHLFEIPTHVSGGGDDKVAARELAICREHREIPASDFEGDLAEDGKPGWDLGCLEGFTSGPYPFLLINDWDEGVALIFAESGLTQMLDRWAGRVVGKGADDVA